MAATRLTLLMLPQLSVLYAYRTFHDTVVTVLPAASASLQFGLLTDTMVLIVVGVLTLTANCLIVAYLLKRVAGEGAPSSGRRRTAAFPAPDRRSSGPTAHWHRRPTPRPRDRPIRSPSPGTGRIDPRRREDRG